MEIARPESARKRLPDRRRHDVAEIEHSGFKLMQLNTSAHVHMGAA
jgi:hypothetical protein